MTISKIYIGGFGRLKDFTLNLDTGLNVIFGENEEGKTTVMTFLKMMFYGSGRAGQQLSRNPRKKYTPWDGGSMGGRVYFTHGGRNYCLEREFRTGDSTDRVILRDLDLGTGENVGPDIGVRFFGLGAAAFERSVFIGQTGAAARDDAANGELNGRLSNLALTGDENTSYQLVYSRLKDAEQQLTTVRHAGLYDKGLVQLKELETKLSRAEETAERRAALEEQADLLKTQLAAARAECDAVKRIVDSEEEQKNAARLREYIAAKEALDAISKELTTENGKTDEMFIGKVNFCLSRYEAAQQRAAEKREDVRLLNEEIRTAENADGRFSPEHLAELQAQAERISSERAHLSDRITEAQNTLHTAEAQRSGAQHKRKPFHPVLLSVGAGLLLLGCVLMLLSYLPAGGALAAAGLLTAVLSLVLRPVDRTALTRAEQALAEAQRRLVDLQQNDNRLAADQNCLTNEIYLESTALNTDRALLEQRRADLAARQEALADAEKRRDAAFDDLLSLTGRFTQEQELTNIRQALDELTRKVEELKQRKLRLNYLRNDLGDISCEQAAARLQQCEQTAGADTDFAAARAELARLKEHGAELSDEFIAVTTELRTAFADTENPETIRAEIAALNARLQSQKEFCEASSLARQVLEDSFAEVRSGYGAVLEQKTLEIFAHLTGGRYSGMTVSNALELEAEQTGCFGMRSIEALSAGTVDQAYLSLRLALSDLMGSDERLPVFLDDVLSQYDDGRMAQAVTFLKEYCADSQAVLFTCHQAVCHAAAETGISPQRLNG